MNEDKRILTQYQALVMQLHAAGAEIETRLGGESEWQPCTIPDWFWYDCRYRPAPALTDELVYVLPWDKYQDAICAAMDEKGDWFMYASIPLLAPGKKCYTVSWGQTFYTIGPATDFPWLQSFTLRPGLGDLYPSLTPYCLPAREAEEDMSIKMLSMWWEHEDELPEMTDLEYALLFPESRVINGVRMFPYTKYFDHEKQSEVVAWLGA